VVFFLVETESEQVFFIVCFYSYRRWRSNLGRRGRVVHTVLITTNVVSSNPAHGEVYFDTTLCDKVYR